MRLSKLMLTATVLLVTACAGDFAAAHTAVALPDPVKDEAKATATASECSINFIRQKDCHQDYLCQHPYNPYIMINDTPKLAALQTQFPHLYRE